MTTDDTQTLTSLHTELSAYTNEELLDYATSTLSGAGAGSFETLLGTSALVNHLRMRGYTLHRRGASVTIVDGNGRRKRTINLE